MTRRWSIQAEDRIEIPTVDAFLQDIIALYEKHGMCLTHEDTQGGFIVRPYISGVEASDENARWLNNASYDEHQE